MLRFVAGLLGGVYITEDYGSARRARYLHCAGRLPLVWSPMTTCRQEQDSDPRTASGKARGGARRHGPSGCCPRSALQVVRCCIGETCILMLAMTKVCISFLQPRCCKFCDTQCFPSACRRRHPFLHLRRNAFPGERSESNVKRAVKRYSRIVKRVRVTSHGGGERAPSFPREVRPGEGGAGATELSIVPSSRQEIE